MCCHYIRAMTYVSSPPRSNYVKRTVKQYVDVPSDRVFDLLNVGENVVPGLPKHLENLIIYFLELVVELDELKKQYYPLRAEKLYRSLLEIAVDVDELKGTSFRDSGRCCTVDQRARLITWNIDACWVIILSKLCTIISHRRTPRVVWFRPIFSSDS